MMAARRSFLSRRALLGRTMVGALALVGAGLAGCADLPTAGGGRGGAGGEPPETVQSTFFAFDTACVVGGVMARPALDGAVAQCVAFERLFSRTIGTSDVARMNAARGATTDVDPATAELVAAALDYRAASDGSFDVTIGAVSELWDFVHGVVPDAAAVEAALPHVGAEVLVDLGASTITIPDPAARLDLGGIAKGYVADAVIDALGQAGVESAYVNLGGNVAVLGAKPDGTPWSVGVRDPFAAAAAPHGTEAAGETRATSDATASVIATIPVTDGSVVTSGLYERSFEVGGRRYWHILDPRTGYPVETDVLGASVFASRSLDGEGLTKPLFFLGEEGSLDFLAARSDVQGLLVMDDGRLVTTPASDFVQA